MSDSFFTARNHFDRQINNPTMDPVSCTMLIEAAARRIARIDGPLEAAKQLQRAADICAGAHVLPIDHWVRLGAATNASEAEPDPIPAKPPLSRGRRLWKLVAGNPAVVFWLGVWVGLVWEGLLGAFWEGLWR